MRTFLLALLSLLLTNAHAQDLTGIWRGHFISGNGNSMMVLPEMEDRYKFEVQLIQKDKLFQGVTYSYKTTVFYGKASCYGAVNKQNKKVFLEETKILEVKSATNGACIMTCFLQYSKVGKEEVLEGHYTSMSTTDSTQCGRGTVYLRRVETSDFYKEPFLVQKEKHLPPPTTSLKPPAAPKTLPQKTPAQKPALTQARPKPVTPRPVPLPPTVQLPKRTDESKSINSDSNKSMLNKLAPSFVIPPVLATRQNELVRTITTAARKISIRIYDNGTIDNDTVSVYVDKKLVISKARLSETAIELSLTLDETIAQHELVMVAENLGEIPPNTSLMVVTAGDQQYEVRISSTEQQNAVVLFRFDPHYVN